MRKLDLNESASVIGGANCSRIGRRLDREIRRGPGNSRTVMSLFNRYYMNCGYR